MGKKENNGREDGRKTTKNENDKNNNDKTKNQTLPPVLATEVMEGLAAIRAKHTTLVCMDKLTGSMMLLW